MKNRGPVTLTILTLVLVGLLFLGVPLAAANKSMECDGATMEAAINPVGDLDVRGTATLCIEDNGVRGEAVVTGLTPGDAYTVWWVYIDDPLGMDDPVDPLAVLGRFDSAVPQDSNFTFMGRAHGLLLSSGSILRLPVFGHGAADGKDHRFRAREVLTPQDPGLGAPGLGTIGDGPVGHPVAVAVFNIP